MQRKVPRVCCALAGALASLMVGAAHAEDLVGVSRLAGDWNNDASGENLKIERSLLGWDIWISNSGQARISDELTAGANVRVDGRGFSCWYYVTMHSAEKMDWELRKGGSEPRCLQGSFTKIEVREHHFAFQKPVTVRVSTKQSSPWRLAARKQSAPPLTYDPYCSCYVDGSHWPFAAPTAEASATAFPGAAVP